MRWNHDQINVSFGEVLAQRRHDMKIEAPSKFTQRAVAHAIGLRSPESISRIERGHRITMLRPRQFWVLADVLRLRPEEMLEAAGYLADAPPGYADAVLSAKPLAARRAAAGSRGRRVGRR